MSELERYQNLKREVEVIGQAHDLLMTGRFPGGAAQTLAVCQAYMKGLYSHMKAECDKMAPLEPSLASTPKSTESSVESNPSPVPVDSSKAS